ncbi:MAG: 2-phospho-L-lactate guanylyltransferase [Candidatus Binataceae bacterium]
MAVRAILIAAKELSFAKTRLASVLPSAAERSALAEAMFRDVLSAALSTPMAAMVAVITSDRRLLGLARQGGALPIDEEYPRGLNNAAGLATEVLIARGARTVCTLLSDCPLITAEDIGAVFDAMPEADRAAVLVPSFDFSGTNMIARSPADVIATYFGRLSLARHVEACHERGIGCRTLRLTRPALDLDVPSDLIEFARTPSMTHTFGHLSRLGMIHG